MSNYKEEPYHFHDFKAESPKTPDRKCLWVLCIDISYSMTPHMDQLRQSLQQFKDEVKSDPVAADRIEVAIVLFSEKVKVVNAPKMVSDLKIPDLIAEASTFLVEGVERAIQVLDNRVAWYQSTYQSYYRPYITLITDGEPNGPGDVKSLARTIKERVNHPDPKKRFFFLAFGVDGADMDMLKVICDDKIPPYFVKRQNFAGLFEFLSASAKGVGNSNDDSDAIIAHLKESADTNDDFQQPI